MNDESGIFLTWDTSVVVNLHRMQQTARKLRDMGNTFRGCSYDVKVPQNERCPVCKCPGLMDETGLAGLSDEHIAQISHTEPFGWSRLRQGNNSIRTLRPKVSPLKIVK